jgi:hypothetical protein
MGRPLHTLSHCSKQTHAASGDPHSQVIASPTRSTFIPRLDELISVAANSAADASLPCAETCGGTTARAPCLAAWHAPLATLPASWRRPHCVSFGGGLTSSNSRASPPVWWGGW